jgi:predicted lipoprotein with Yx(FWY)xxD motif
MRAWGLATTTPGGGRAIVGGKVDSSGCPARGGNDRDGPARAKEGIHIRVWFGSKGIALDHRAGSRSRPGPVRGLRRPLVALVALAAVGVLAAGCGSSNGSGSGGSGSGGYGSGGAAPTSKPPSGMATVTAASTKLGMVLVDGSGRTLYLFEKDQPNQSACSGACVAAWPIDQSSGTPKAGGGVKASLLGTISRGDGTTQVAYNGHPLYYYAGDSGAGQLNGQGIDAFGAKWFVVTPNGGADTGA